MIIFIADKLDIIDATCNSHGSNWYNIIQVFYLFTSTSKLTPLSNIVITVFSFVTNKIDMDQNRDWVRAFELFNLNLKLAPVLQVLWARAQRPSCFCPFKIPW